MGLFKKKSKPPDMTSAGGQRPSVQRGGGSAAPPQANDPSLPGLAGWRGGARTGQLLRFNYVRPDGKPDRQRDVWSEDPGR
jgi:hypothetical protein